ncbi:MAG: type II toxin-antitoxin system Phd/YefM family antitoxin [Thalassobaculum sp.]|uniref:type II toxin-antitoxin system Phd/YefM family antitoxin n=1 Tax=Thalassobaculum sp. TaxID=2022740 RepID=UPI0032ED62E2
MAGKFSDDAIPLSELKADPDRVVGHVLETGRPVLLTSEGHGVAVVQSIAGYEESEEERAFMRAVAQGLADIEAGRHVSLAEAKARFGLE